MSKHNRMQIFIIGNIASGKSTIAKQLSKIYKIKHFSIDNIRKKVNLASDIYGEYLSWDTLKKIVQTNDSIIIESTGTSKHYESLLSLSKFSKIIIKVDTSVAQCHKNFLKRSKNSTRSIPIPYDFDIKKSLIRNQMILNAMYYDFIYDYTNPDPLIKILDTVLSSKINSK